MSEPIVKLAYMSDDLFDGCWQRLDRAAEHRKAGTALWNEYLAPHPYDYTVIDNQDGTYVVRVTQDTPVPAELGILIGDCLYNLRATLDNVIWATAARGWPLRGTGSLGSRPAVPSGSFHCFRGC